MDDNGGGRVQSGDEEDRLSNLPESLLFQVLLNLSTKDVVNCSSLSSKWRNLWRFLPGLDLEHTDFPEFKAFVRFVDMYLDFNTESCLENLKLKFHLNDVDKPAIKNFTRWINTVVDRKVQHLHVSDTMLGQRRNRIQIPPTVYTCESLVSLELRGVILADPEFVSLPCVKVINLHSVKFANGLALEMLISGCPVLESLTIIKNYFDNGGVVLRVRSSSLLRVMYSREFDHGIDTVVVIDAPRLERLVLIDQETANLVISSPGSFFKVLIDVVFKLSSNKSFDLNDLPRGIVIRNFLVGISSVKDMEITSYILQVIYEYSRCEPLPIFHNLSFLRVDITSLSWKCLSIFLECCPNLTSVVVKLPLCLANSRKKENSLLIEKFIHTRPRLSTSCRVVVCWTPYQQP